MCATSVAVRRWESFAYQDVCVAQQKSLVRIRYVAHCMTCMYIYIYSMVQVPLPTDNVKSSAEPGVVRTPVTSAPANPTAAIQVSYFSLHITVRSLCVGIYIHTTRNGCKAALCTTVSTWWRCGFSQMLVRP